MSITTDTIAAEIIVEPTTGNIDLIVEQPVVIVDAPAAADIIVDVVGLPGQPGPPGETILDGDGPPSAALGVVGDFYLDMIGHALYGPKLAASLGDPTNAYGPNAPSLYYSGIYSMGNKFTALTPGQIVGLRFYRHASEGATTGRTARLYKTDGTLLATSTPSSEDGSAGWIEVSLATPVDVAAGQSFVVAVNRPSGYPYGPETASREPDLRYDGGFFTASLDAFPSTGPDAYTYGTDVTIRMIPSNVWRMAILTDQPLPPEADINLNVDYGNTAGVAGSYHTIIGAQASGGGAGAYVLGCRAVASGTYAGALGYGAYAAGNDSLALGRNTLAQLSGSVAIGTDDVGAGAQATVANQIVLGTAKHSLKVPGPATFSAASTFVGYLTMGTGIQNNQPTAANHLTRKDYVDGKWTKWSGTQAQYDAIVTKDPNTLYVVV